MATVEEQIAAYRRTDARVRAAILAYIARSWVALGSYRDADIDRWVAEATPIISGGLMQIATLTDAHLATMIATMADDRPRPLGVRPADVTVEALRGVPAAEVYRRAGETVWSELSRGTDPPNAIRRGLDRATGMAEIDMQLAKTHTAREVFTADQRVVGYRRAPNAGACKLCLTASTQRYRTGDLMPIHGSCACSVVPIVGDRDPGRVIDKDLLRRIKAGETETAVHQHGEVGPVLTDASHTFATI